jgi:hypothetical protein
VFPRRLSSGDRVEVQHERRVGLVGSPKICEIAPLSTTTGFTEARASIAATCLRRAGLEIGAFTRPTDLSPVEGLTGRAVARRAAELEGGDFSIHFHVRDENTFVSFITSSIQKFDLPFCLLFTYSANHEVSVIIEKVQWLKACRRPLDSAQG